VVVGSRMKMKILSAGTVVVAAGVFVGGDAAADVGAGAGRGVGWDERLYTWPARDDDQNPKIPGVLVIALV
jgi:hypothetical protein